jgi:hypothetical protein
VIPVARKVWDVTLKQMVSRHRVLLAAFLVEPDPPALAPRMIVLDIHMEGGGDAGETVYRSAISARSRNPIAAI